jgi:hypothetical protein
LKTLRDGSRSAVNRVRGMAGTPPAANRG